MKHITTAKSLKRGLRIAAAMLTSATLFGFLTASPAAADEPNSSDIVCQTEPTERPDGKYQRFYIVLDSTYADAWLNDEIKDDGDNQICNDFHLGVTPDSPNYQYRGPYNPDQDAYAAIAATVTVEDGLPSECGRVTDDVFNVFVYDTNGNDCEELHVRDTPFTD